jgi:hypothetical protein
MFEFKNIHSHGLTCTYMWIKDEYYMISWYQQNIAPVCFLVASFYNKILPLSLKKFASGHANPWFWGRYSDPFQIFISMKTSLAVSVHLSHFFLPSYSFSKFISHQLQLSLIFSTVLSLDHPHIQC